MYLVSYPIRFAAESINRSGRNARERHVTRPARPLNQPVTYDDDDRGNETSCAHGAACTGAFNRLLLPRRCARLLLAVHLLGRRVLVGTWTGSGVCIRLRDGGVTAGGNAS